MNFSRELILPMNKKKVNSQNEIVYANPPNIINLILPTHQKISSIFKLSDKATQKLILNKKGLSLKNLNTKRKIPLIKPDRILLKSCSGNKNIFNKVNYIKKKSMSFCLPPNKNIQNEIINSSHQHMSGESELFTKIKLTKNIKSYHSSRNINYLGSPVELNRFIKNIKSKSKSKSKSKVKNIKSYINLKITKSSGNKLNNFIPKFKTKISLKSYISQQRNGKLKQRIKITKGELGEINNNSQVYEKNGNNLTNIIEKENNMNLTNVNENNISTNDNMIFSRPRKKESKTKINLPISPPTNRDKYKREKKIKKCYIRNEINIPYNKNNLLTRQNSYYNLISHRRQRDQKLKINISRDEQSLLTETEMFKKNNSMSSIELPNTTKNIKSNKYLKTEYNNNINYNKSESNLEKKSNIDNSFSVEMNHFRIVKFIQDTKKMLFNNNN